MISIISILFTSQIKAQNLDLSDIDRKDFRSHLRPAFSVISSQNELPALMGFFNESRKLMFATSVINVYNIYDGNEKGIYIPSFWGGFVTSPNLSLFMQLSQGVWQQENITSFGPVINFIWGEEAKENVINISINHLQGPDDFRMKDISLSLLKKNEFDKFSLFYGITSHYVNSRIEVQNTDEKKTINETLYHFRAGLYKKISFVDMGIELDLTKETIISKYKLVLII